HRSAPRRRELDRRALPDRRRHRRSDPSLLGASAHAEGLGLGPPRDRPLAARPARHQPAYPLAGPLTLPGEAPSRRAGGLPLPAGVVSGTPNADGHPMNLG